MEDKTNYYLKYFVRETKPENNYSQLIDETFNSREEYEKIVSIKSKRKNKRNKNDDILSSTEDEVIVGNEKELASIGELERVDEQTSISYDFKRNFPEEKMRSSNTKTHFRKRISIKDHTSSLNKINHDIKEAPNIFISKKQSPDVIKHNFADISNDGSVQKQNETNDKEKINYSVESEALLEIKSDYETTNFKCMVSNSDIATVNSCNDTEIMPQKNVTLSKEQIKDIIYLSSDEEETMTHCSICDTGVPDSNFKQHILSTVHQFNKQLKYLKETNTEHVSYSIPENNKGFQILLKNGWNKNFGLGKNGAGIKIPIKIKEKKDKQGIGRRKSSVNMHRIKPEHNVKFNHKLKKKLEKKKEMSYRIYVNLIMDNPKKSLAHLTQIEEQAEEILCDQQEVVALDKRRNGTREALRALSKTSENKVWMALGPLLFKVNKSKAEAMLKKDQIVVDCEVNKLRSNLKVKVNKLRDMEYESPVPGLMLKPMQRNEMSAMNQVLGK